jgi:hypothetical protein
LEVFEIGLNLEIESALVWANGYYCPIYIGVKLF